MSLNPPTAQIVKSDKAHRGVPSQVNTEHKHTRLGCCLSLLGLSLPAHRSLTVSLFSLLSPLVKNSTLFLTSPVLSHHFTSWQKPTLPLNNSNNNKVKLRTTDLPMCSWFEICCFCFRLEEGLAEQRACLVSFIVCLLFISWSNKNLV